MPGFCINKKCNRYAKIQDRKNCEACRRPLTAAKQKVYGEEISVLLPIPKAMKKKKKALSLLAPQKYAAFVFNYSGEDDDVGRYIGTWGMDPCVALVCYDSASHSGMVAHFDGDSDKVMKYWAPDVAKSLLSKFCKITKHDNFTVWIVTGQNPEQLDVDHSDLLSQLPPGKLRERKMKQRENGMYGSGYSIVRKLYKALTVSYKNCTISKSHSISGDILLNLANGKLYHIPYARRFEFYSADDKDERTGKSIGSERLPEYAFNKIKSQVQKSSKKYKIVRLKLPCSDAQKYQSVNKL